MYTAKALPMQALQALWWRAAFRPKLSRLKVPLLADRGRDGTCMPCLRRQAPKTGSAARRACNSVAGLSE